MKVKNIAFSGFAAAILAMGAAQAEVPQIASKSYVDTKVSGVDTRVETLETFQKDINTTIVNTITEQLKEDGEIAAKLADKVDSSEKTDSIVEGTDSAKIPTVGAVTTYTQNAIDAKFGEDGLTGANIANGAITNEKIADKAVTADKLSDALNEKIDAAQTAEQVSTAIGTAVTTEGALKTALDSKVTSAQVDSAIEAYAIPKPDDECSADSTRCLLSVDTSGKLTWIAVTAPLGDE